MSDTFNFDSTRHVYTLNGREIPGITRVLTDMGYDSAGARFYTPASRERGQQVHLLCQLVDEHCPAADSLEEVAETLDLTNGQALLPYLEGYLLFKREFQFTPVLNERPLYSKRLQIGAIADKTGLLPDGHAVIVELKTWDPAPVNPERKAELQTAAQALILREHGIAVDGRYVVALPGNGKYRAYECGNPRDEVLIPALSALWWDRHYAGLLNGG